MGNFIYILAFFFIANLGYGQLESKIKFKPIQPKVVPVKPKPVKDLPAESSGRFQLNFPKIIAPNALKETNIFGNKKKENNSFQIGLPNNSFSMVQKKKFEYSLGTVYQDKMTKDLDKSLVEEGLKEDKTLLDKSNKDMGEYRTKSKFFTFKYRDYIQIDGDLINIYSNDKILRSNLYLNSELGEFRIPLEIGFNNIEIIVASTGTSGGNTAEIHFFDDVNRSITTEYWNNKALGVKIKMIVIRE